MLETEHRCVTLQVRLNMMHPNPGSSNEEIRPEIGEVDDPQLELSITILDNIAIRTPRPDASTIGRTSLRMQGGQALFKPLANGSHVPHFGTSSKSWSSLLQVEDSHI